MHVIAKLKPGYHFLDHSVQFQHFERSLVFSAENVNQIVNLKAINRYIQHHYCAVVFLFLVRKPCYNSKDHVVSL